MTDEAPRTESILLRAKNTSADTASLEALLGGQPVEVEHLEAVDLWIVRGAPPVIDALRDPRGPLLASNDYEIAPDITFTTT